MWETITLIIGFLTGFILAASIAAMLALFWMRAFATGHREEFELRLYLAVVASIRTGPCESFFRSVSMTRMRELADDRRLLKMQAGGVIEQLRQIVVQLESLRIYNPDLNGSELALRTAQIILRDLQSYELDAKVHSAESLFDWISPIANEWNRVFAAAISDDKTGEWTTFREMHEQMVDDLQTLRQLNTDRIFWWRD